jgi:hypothetical protein
VDRVRGTFGAHPHVAVIHPAWHPQDGQPIRRHIHLSHECSLSGGTVVVLRRHAFVRCEEAVAGGRDEWSLAPIPDLL